jgi:hypothetical protein
VRKTCLFNEKCIRGVETWGAETSFNPRADSVADLACILPYGMDGKIFEETFILTI